MNESSMTGRRGSQPVDEHPKWCTAHEDVSDLDYHATGMTEIAGASINMTTGTIEGDVRIFGLHDAGGRDRECITLDEAEALAFHLLGLVQAARA